MLKKRLLGAAAALALLTATAGCASSGADAGAGPGDRLGVVASFYPLQYVAQRVGGDRVSVTSLTKPGAEPHDLELTPQDVAAVSDARLVVYLGGFQPAVDEAVAAQAADTSFDAAPAADLDLTYTPIEEGQEVKGAAGATDPHFWLDPRRLSRVSAALEKHLAAVDPAGADAYRTNLAALQQDLDALDSDLRTGLASCTNRDLVTSHNAFGYLAQRYGLRQVGITGLTPEAEPDPAELADVTQFVRRHHVRTIYYETLVSPAIARTVAAETGAATAVLDPIEGLNDESQGDDYLAVMRANLANLQQGQPCP